MRSYLAFAAHRPRVLLAAFAVTAAIALVFASRLELHTDLAELLPASHPAVAALATLGDRQRLGQSLIVLVESPDRDADLRFLAALRPRLAASTAFAEIDGGPDRDLAAWKHRWRWLYTDLPTLERAEQLLDRAYLEHNPLFLSLDEDGDPRAELKQLELSHPEPPAAGHALSDEDHEDPAEHPRSLPSAAGTGPRIRLRRRQRRHQLPEPSRGHQPARRRHHQFEELSATLSSGGRLAARAVAAALGPPPPLVMRVL